MNKLTPDKTKSIGDLVIYEKIIPWGTKWKKDVYHNGKILYKKGSKYKADRLLSSNTGKVGGITIHNTGGDADGEGYTRATYPNQNMLSSRVHFYVDDKEIWQNLREDEVGWHAGDGSGPGNDSTISIEILLAGKKVKDARKAEENGAKLCAFLLDKHQLSIDYVYSHKHWSGKNCPANILPRWDDFLKRVENHLKPIGEEKDILYRVQLGAFKNKNNAMELERRIKALGFDAYIYKK